MLQRSLLCLLITFHNVYSGVIVIYTITQHSTIFQFIKLHYYVCQHLKLLLAFKLERERVKEGKRYRNIQKGRDREREREKRKKGEIEKGKKIDRQKGRVREREREKIEQDRERQRQIERKKEWEIEGHREKDRKKRENERERKKRGRSVKREIVIIRSNLIIKFLVIQIINYIEKERN